MALGMVAGGDDWNVQEARRPAGFFAYSELSDANIQATRLLQYPWPHKSWGRQLRGRKPAKLW